jgi:hypothetical protein
MRASVLVRWHSCDVNVNVCAGAACMSKVTCICIITRAFIEVRVGEGVLVYLAHV